jgi:hypothetical protein
MDPTMKTPVQAMRPYYWDEARSTAREFADRNGIPYTELFDPIPTDKLFFTEANDRLQFRIGVQHWLTMSLVWLERFPVCERELAAATELTRWLAERKLFWNPFVLNKYAINREVYYYARIRLDGTYTVYEFYSREAAVEYSLHSNQQLLKVDGMQEFLQELSAKHMLQNSRRWAATSKDWL